MNAHSLSDPEEERAMRLTTGRLLLGVALLIGGASVAAAQGLQMGGGGGDRGGARAQVRAQGGGGEVRGGSRAQMRASPARSRESAAPRMSRSEGVRSRATVRSESRAAPRATQRSVSRQDTVRSRNRATVRSERADRGRSVRSETRQRATVGTASRQDRATPRARQSDREARRDADVRSRAASDTRVRDRSTTGRGAADANMRARDRDNERARAQIRTTRTTITAQQQTRLRQTVRTARNVPRLNRVNFALRRGVIVPRHVRFVSVVAFPVIYDIFPAYRPYRFFVVEDDIVFVDSGYRIVDVVPLEGAGVYAAGGPGGAVAMDVDLTREEIIEVQRVLVAEGFAIEVDGVWGPGTREALVTFQRRRGLPAIGVIDTRTVAALRLTGKISERHIRDSGRASTTTRDDVSRPRSDRPDAAARRDEPAARRDEPGRARSQDRATTGRGAADEPRAMQDRGRANAAQGAQPRADRGMQDRPQLGERSSAPRATTGQSAPRATTGQGTSRERGRMEQGPRN
jgi:peptidoglycan hydrolase-like protein with peptidoglycan-binding domain